MQFKTFMENLREEKTIEVTMKSGHKFTAPIKMTHKDWHIVKHPVSGKQYRVDHKGNTLSEEAIDESTVEFRLDHRDKVKGDHKSTFADHEAKVSDTTDKATYVKVPSHKADSFKSAMKTKHGVTAELAEEVELELHEGIDKNHPIVKEYDTLKKNHDIKSLRGLIKTQHKIVDTSEFRTKDHAISHYLRAKHGNKKVADAFGLKEDFVSIEEAAASHTMEAHGVKGMKNTPWRKSFKSHEHAHDWAEKNDAEIHGTRDLEQAKKGNLSPAMREEALQEGTQSHKVNVTVSDPNHTAVSMRKEKIAKRVVVTANDKGDALAKAKSFYQKKGYKVHDVEHHSVVPKTTMKTEAVVDTQPRSDYKLDKAGRKDHKQIVFHDGTQNKELDDKLKREGVEIEEAINLNSKVKIHAPGKDYHDQVGHVGEIRHGAYKGAPKTYTVDYGDRKSVQLDKKNIKLHKEEVDIEEAKQFGLPAHAQSHVEKKIKAGEWEATHDIKAGRHLEIIDHSNGGKRKTIHVKEENAMQEEMTDAQKQERERLVKGMKKNIAGFKAKYGERAKSVMYATATKNAMKEETEEQRKDREEQLKKFAGQVEGNDHCAEELEEGYDKTSEHHKAAKAMARQHGGKATFNSDGTAHVRFNDAVTGRSTVNPKGTLLHTGSEAASRAAKDHGKGKADGNTVHFKEEVELDEAFINGREYASHGLMHPDHAKMGLHQKNGNTIDFYHSKTGDKIPGKVTKNDGKEVHIRATNGEVHKYKVTPHLPKKVEEATDTVTKDKSGKIVSWKHVGDWKKANPKKDPVGTIHNLAGQALKKSKELAKEEFEVDVLEEAVESDNKGYGYHGAHPSETADKEYSKAHATVKKVAGAAGHLKDAKKPNVMVKHYLDSRHGRHLADVGTHDHEYIKKDFGKFKKNYNPAMHEAANFDQEGNLMAEKLKFSDFIEKMNEQLLEYESDDSGVYRHTKKATYGTSYQGDDDEDDKPKKAAAPAEKRGRGRPAGSTGASYKPRSAATAAAAKAKAAATKAANKNK